MSRPTRHLTLSEPEDAALRDLELSAGIHPKVRLRASVLRLNAQGWGIPRLARHFARSSAAVHKDLDRYEQHGLGGLSDHAAPGNPALITCEMQAFLHLACWPRTGCGPAPYWVRPCMITSGFVLSEKRCG